MKDIISERPGAGPGATRPANRAPAPPGASPAEAAAGGTPPGEGAAAEAAAEFLVAVSAVRRATRRAARRSWQTEPLPPAQSELLRLAASMPGLTVAQAAHELRLAPNTVSTLVGKLADQGLLKRVPSRADGRSVLLEATASARRRLAEWRDLRAELAGRALAGMSGQDRAALAAAVPAMLRLAGQMEADPR